MKGIFVISVITMVIAVMVGCADFYSLEAHNRLMGLRDGTNDITNIDTTPPSLLVSPGNITTNKTFTAILTASSNYGYWSTNSGFSFTKFAQGDMNIAINNDTSLCYYGDDGVHTSLTQTVVYTFDTTAPTVTVSPSGDITTSSPFVVRLSVDENYGYWSTNFANFVRFSAPFIDVIIGDNTTNIRYYGGDTLGNISSTNSNTYTFFCDKIYVSTDGNDANDGKTCANAVLSIQNAIELAVSYGYNNVYVEAGTYMQGAGLSNSMVANKYAGIKINGANNINLIGGWDNGFSTQSGYSILDGTGTSPYHVIWVQDLTNFTINGFVVQNGDANLSSPPQHQCGGGLYFKNVSNSLIINCIIYNNHASCGGGIYMQNCDHNNIDGNIHNNIATEDGGGIYFKNGGTNTISGSILSNIANINGGGVYIFNTSTNNTFTGSCVIRWNTVTGGAVSDGGGVYNGVGAGSQTTNAGFTCSDNFPDDWADKP